MEKDKLNDILGDELFNSIYKDVIIQSNNRILINTSDSGDKICEITDPIVLKLYNNIRYCLKQLSISQLSREYEDSTKNLFSYINSHGYKTEYNYICDKSLKKSIDVLLTPLLRKIIEDDRYITTSCCSGRILFFERDMNFQNKKNSIYGRSGRILYSSHSHILNETFDEILESIESNPKNKFNCYSKEEEIGEEETKDDSNPASSDDLTIYTNNEVILKFEPFIIHVECSTIEDAAHLLNICKNVGLKQSGISSIKKKVILAIRGNNILETPIMKKCYKIEKNVPALLENRYLINKNYLIELINTCNNKMTLNFYQFLTLYHKLIREMKFYEQKCSKYEQTHTHFDGFDLSHEIEEGKTEIDCKYIDVVRTSKLVGVEKMSIPLELEKQVKILSFGEESNNLLRTRCNLASSKDFVVLFGGYEKSKTKTICVCDLKNVEIGFKVLDIDEKGPDCLIDSSLLSDGNVFITFGGRKNGNILSNDIYLLHVYEEKETIQGDWIKCDVKGRYKPIERFRHSVCMVKKGKEGSNPDSSNSEYTCSFFMSGGASSCNLIDENLLGDVWKCTLTYKNKNKHIVCPTAEWECLYYDASFGWSSGSLAHNPDHCSLLLIGGYKNLDDFLNSDIKYMDHVLTLNLKTRQLSNLSFTPSKCLYDSKPSANDKSTVDYNGSKSLDNLNFYDQTTSKIPTVSLSHCLVPLKHEDYLLIGGFGSLMFLDEVWYINTKQRIWHKTLSLPKGTRARFGSCLVNFKYRNCNHSELWLIGGGVPAMLTYGSAFDNPLRIVLNCESKCQEPPNAIKHNIEDSYIGLYILVESSKFLKYLKNKLEALSLYDKSRKIFQFDAKCSYIFHTHFCQSTGIYSFCTKCKNTLLCSKCKCCSYCNHSRFSSLTSCFFIPVLKHLDIPDYETSTFKIYSELKVWNKTPSGPKDRLLSIINCGEIDKVIRSVLISGNAMLITVSSGSSLPKIDWEFISKEFKVASVALVGEIEGQKRQRNVQLLYGNGDVFMNENGVIYHYNISTNMFSKGNSAERIRIPKMYFGYSNESEDITLKFKESEIIVDFFCGIGYFSISILKYTDKRVVSKALCVDINDAAIKYIMINAKENGIDLDRIDTRVKNCEEFGITFGKEYENRANRVLLGLLPTSEIGWEPALRAINKETGGILHIHGLTRNKIITKFEGIVTNQPWSSYLTLSHYTDEDFKRERELGNNCEVFTTYTLRTFYELCKTLSFMNNSVWKLQILHVQTVKHYSPHKYHQVIDLKLTPIY